MRHHAIIVTGSYGDWLANAHAEALKIFPIVSPILDSRMNDYRTFFIPPDGSKEGWEASNTGDARREEFIAYLESLRHEDKSSPLEWVEVQYADDEGDNRVLRTSDYEDE